MQPLLSQLETSPDLLTVREVAAILRVDRSYVYRLVRTCRLAAIRPTPHKTWVPKSALQSFLDAAVAPPTQPVSPAVVASEVRDDA
jgi:excisionase family DNA binding protein